MKFSAIPILAVCLLQTACVGIDGSPGGETTTRTSEPSEFDRIALVGGFEHVDVQVCGDCAPRVKITGDDRQVDEVIIAVDDGKLELRLRKRLVVTNIDLDAVIRVPSLRWLEQSGSSAVKIEGVAVESFDLVSSGSGSISVEGVVDTLSVIASGSGDVDAYDLEANAVDVTLSGSGDAHVCAKDRLRAVSTGSGDVFYDCNPDTTDFDSTGSGRISIR